VFGPDIAGADDLPVDDHGELEIPRVGTHRGSRLPVEAHRLPLQLRRRQIGPRDQERHHRRVVYTSCRNGDELLGEVVVEVAQGEPRCAHLQVEQWPVVVPHRPSVADPYDLLRGIFEPSSSRSSTQRCRPRRVGREAAVRRDQSGTVDRGDADALRAPRQPLLPGPARGGHHRPPIDRGVGMTDDDRRT
jgi:hypothetical protein